MSTSITVRHIDPTDQSWLKREARLVGVSLEEFVRRIIYEKREKTESRPRPSKPSPATLERGNGVPCWPGTPASSAARALVP